MKYILTLFTTFIVLSASTQIASYTLFADQNFSNVRTTVDAELSSAELDNISEGNTYVYLKITNVGSAYITSLDIEWSFNGGATNYESVIGINVAPGQIHTEVLFLGDLVKGGPYPFNATITLVNSNTDPNMNNNSITTEFNIVYFIQNWTMTDTDGKNWTMYDELSAGKMVILFFLTSWCGIPCSSSTPYLNDLYVNHTTNGLNNLNVFGITISPMDNNDATLNNLGWGATFPKFSYSATTDSIVSHYENVIATSTVIPIFYMICPNVDTPGRSTLIHLDVGLTTNDFNTVYESKFADCPAANNTFPNTINESNKKFNIYPNPARNELIINGAYTSIDIYDIFGKIALSANTQKNINVSALSNGVYFLNIYLEDATTTIRKITIAR